MIIFKLFFTFLQVGAFTFGGGYAMISIIREKVLANGWLTEESLVNMIAVSESTPGPIAVNMATFVGSEQAGILGAIFATLGVVLPSFIIILLISSLARRFMEKKWVKASLSGIRPCVVGLIFGTALTLFATEIIGFSGLCELPSVDFRGIIILSLLLAVGFGYKKLRGKKPSPILMILLSAVLGGVLYSIW